MSHARRGFELEAARMALLCAALLLAPVRTSYAQAPACDATRVARACAAAGVRLPDGAARAPAAGVARATPRDTVHQAAPPGRWRIIRRDAWRGVKWGAATGAVASGIVCAADDDCDDGSTGGAILESAVWGAVAGATFGAIVGAGIGALRSGH